MIFFSDTPHGCIDEKRVHFPGVIMRDVCKECGAIALLDLSRHYLSHPRLNASETETLCCALCEHEWEVRFRINVRFEVLPDEQPGGEDKVDRASHKDCG